MIIATHAISLFIGALIGVSATFAYLRHVYEDEELAIRHRTNAVLLFLCWLAFLVLVVDGLPGGVAP